MKKVPKPTKRLIATAHHEAGHALLHWIGRVAMREVSIVPRKDDDTVLGHVHGQEPAEWFKPDID